MVPAANVPVTVRARAADGERAVDPQPHVGVAVGRRQPVHQGDQRGADRVEVGGQDEGCARQPLVHLRDGELWVGDVGLADDGQHVADAERFQRGEVFFGLRHPAFGGRDDEHDRGHRTHSREHVGDEPLVARHVDERDLPSADRRPREAEVDGQAAALLLREPVGPDAGQPLHQRGFSVVDVPGGR